MIYAIFLLLALLFTRINAVYHPHLVFRKYVTIRNQKLARILIGQSDPVTPKVKNAKANRNKLTYAGMVFYGLFAVLLVVCAVFWVLPDIPAINHPLAARTLLPSASTLNTIIPGLLTWTLLFGEYSFHVFNTGKYAIEKASAKKLVKGIYAVMFLLGVTMTVLCIYFAIYAVANRV